MTNEVYLDILMTCGRVEGVDNCIYKNLVNCGVNLKEYCNSINKIMSTNTANSLGILLDNLLKVLSRRDSDIDTYIKGYLDFLKVYSKIYRFSSAEDLIMLSSDMDESVEKNLHTGFRELKQVSIESSSYVMLNGTRKKVSISDDFDTDDDWSWLEIEDGSGTNYVSFIFVKDTKVEYKKVNNLEETVQVLHRILSESDSYDVVIYPRTLQDIKDKLCRCYMDKYSIDNKVYLELLKLLSYPEEKFYKSYENIYNSDIDLVRFHKIICWKLLKDDTYLAYNGCILTFGDLLIENVIKYNIDVDIVYELMKEKFEIITYSSGFSYILKLNSEIRTKNVIKVLQTDKLTSIRNIKLPNKECEVKNLRILSTNNIGRRYSLSRDYIDIDVIIYRDKSFEIVDKGRGKLDKDKELLTIIKS